MKNNLTTWSTCAFISAFVITLFAGDDVGKVIAHGTGTIFVVCYGFYVVWEMLSHLDLASKGIVSLKDYSWKLHALIGLTGMNISYIMYAFFKFGASDNALSSILFDFWTFLLIRALHLVYKKYQDSI